MYLINRSPTVAVPGKTPAEIWYGYKPNVSHFRIFGCVCYVQIPNQLRSSKLDDRSIKGAFIGYGLNGYKLWSEQHKKVIYSRDVRFDENVMYFSADKRDTDDLHIPGMPSSPIDLDNIENVITTDAEAYFALNAITNTPETFEDAMNQSDRDKWIDAINTELRAMEEFGVWKLVDIPDNKNVIDTTWTFKRKPTGCRARLVAKGFQQTYGIDYKEIYSPVAKLSTIRTAFSIAVVNGWSIDHLDVITAFLHSLLKEEIFIKIPKGHPLYGKANKCLRLIRAIYGLKQSANEWNKLLKEFMLSIGLNVSCADDCLFIGEDVVVIVYVDDIIIMGKNQNVIDRIKSLIKKRFKVRDLGAIKNFLNINIEYDVNGRVMKLNQKDLIVTILKKFKMLDCNPVKTPIERNLDLENISSNCNVTTYKMLLGFLMYLMVATRPDICYCLSMFSAYQDRATDTHVSYLKRVLRYLKGSMDRSLIFDANNADSILIGFSDADFANGPDRKSISGNLTKVYGNTVHWSSKKQSTVALSSTEAEYISLCYESSEVLWFCKLLKSLNVNFEYPIVINCDNMSCVNLINNFRDNKRVKHIDVKYHFIFNLVRNHVIRLNHVFSNVQEADGLTKALETIKFEKFLSYLKLL